MVSFPDTNHWIAEGDREFLSELIQEVHRAQQDWPSADIIEDLDYYRALDILGEET